MCVLEGIQQLPQDPQHVADPQRHPRDLQGVSFSGSPGALCHANSARCRLAPLKNPGGPPVHGYPLASGATWHLSRGEMAFYYCMPAPFIITAFLSCSAPLFLHPSRASDHGRLTCIAQVHQRAAGHGPGVGLPPRGERWSSLAWEGQQPAGYGGDDVQHTLQQWLHNGSRGGSRGFQGA